MQARVRRGDRALALQARLAQMAVSTDGDRGPPFVRSMLAMRGVEVLHSQEAMMAKRVSMPPTTGDRHYHPRWLAVFDVLKHYVPGGQDKIEEATDVVFAAIKQPVRGPFSDG